VTVAVEWHGGTNINTIKHFLNIIQHHFTKNFNNFNSIYPLFHPNLILFTRYLPGVY
jgi:hypothetical protein